MRKFIATISVIVLFLCSIVLTQTGCDKDSDNPAAANQTTTIRVNWTINGQPAASACPGNYLVEVVIAGPSGPSSMDYACNTGSIQHDVTQPGTYYITTDLKDQNQVILFLHRDTITVVQGQLSTIDVDLVIPGNVQFEWTINGGFNCPSDGTITIYPSIGSVSYPSQSFPCMSSQAIMTGLAPGTYDFQLVLKTPANPLDSAVVSAPGIAIVSGQTAMVGPLDLNCSFCGAPVYADVNVTVTCSGDGCGSTGSLKLVNVSCSTNNYQTPQPLINNYTLVAGTPFTQTVLAVPGTYCIAVFLDVDNNGQRNSGDIVMSTNSVSLIVVNGVSNAITFDLNTIMP